MCRLTTRPVTFTEAIALVQLFPESFIRLFSYINTIWQTEGVPPWRFRSVPYSANPMSVS
jgi:hypothetical protein